MPSEVLLDTDVLSAIMRKHPIAGERARAYLGVHARITFSLITRYEILRGLKVKGAQVQMVAFDRLCHVSRILAVDEPVVVKAAEIYASLHQRGVLIGDADILIGATALLHGVSVVTNNREHFQRIEGLRIEDWLT